jgi:hypothetical protein
LVNQGWFENNRGIACVYNNGGMYVDNHSTYIANSNTTHDIYVNAGGYDINGVYLRTIQANRPHFREEGPGSVWGGTTRPEIRRRNRLRLGEITTTSTETTPQPIGVFMDPNKSELTGRWQTYPVQFGTVADPTSMPPGTGGSTRGEWMRHGDQMFVNIFYRFGGAGQVFANTGSQWAFTLPARTYNDPAGFLGLTTQTWVSDLSTSSRYMGLIQGIMSPDSSQLRLWYAGSSSTQSQQVLTANNLFAGLATAVDGDSIVIRAQYHSVW